MSRTKTESPEARIRRIERNKAYKEAHPEKRKEWSKRWRDKNPDKILEYSQGSKEQRKAYREANRERLLAYQKEWYKKNSEGVNNRVKKYREDKKEHYASLMQRRRQAAQEDFATRPKPPVCEACGDPAARVVFDHWPDTHNMFRSWPCDRCNLVMGACEDNPELLRKIANLLEKSYIERFGSVKLVIVDQPKVLSLKGWSSRKKNEPRN